MGKRELLIAIAFVLVGAVVYQFTAPTAKPGEGRSLRTFFKEVQKDIRGNPGTATVIHKKTLAVDSAVHEIRLSMVNRAVSVVGEARTDVAYEFTVESNGPDDATARTYAEQSVITVDDLGKALALRAKYPPEADQWGSIVLRVPSHLAIRLESGSGVTIAGVAAVHLENIRGNATVGDVAGPITGSHRDGDLKVTGAASVKLVATRSKSTFAKVSRGLTLDIRDGECAVTASAGPLEIDELRAEITVTSHGGPVRVGGSDGRVTVIDPSHETKVDMRRAEVEVAMGKAAAALTILTTDEPLRLIVSGAGFLLDAIATDAKIQAADVHLTPDVQDRESRISHQFAGAATPRVSLRNLRGDIVIRKGS